MANNFCRVLGLLSCIIPDCIFLEVQSINNLFSDQWELHLASLHKTAAREVADRATKNQCIQNHCVIFEDVFWGKHRKKQKKRKKEIKKGNDA